MYAGRGAGTYSWRIPAEAPHARKLPALAGVTNQACGADNQHTWRLSPTAGSSAKSARTLSGCRWEGGKGGGGGGLLGAFSAWNKSSHHGGMPGSHTSSATNPGANSDSSDSSSSTTAHVRRQRQQQRRQWRQRQQPLQRVAARTAHVHIRPQLLGNGGKPGAAGAADAGRQRRRCGKRAGALWYGTPAACFTPLSVMLRDTLQPGLQTRPGMQPDMQHTSPPAPPPLHPPPSLLEAAPFSLLRGGACHPPPSLPVAWGLFPPHL